MKSKMVSLLVMLSILFGMSPAKALASEQSHDAQARYQEEENGEWLYADLDGALANVYAGGRVEILQDIHLDHCLTITKDVTLVSKDGEHPFTMMDQTKNRSDFLFQISSAQVVLEDIILDGGSQIGIVSKAELVGVTNKANLVMEKGAVIQNNHNVSTALGAGGLRVIKDSTVTMKEGALIQNCQALAGGGAAISGAQSQLVLNGGRIERNQAFIGGAIFIQEKGVLRLNDGSIAHNEAKKEIDGLSFGFGYTKGQGGGIYVDSGYVYMFGGTIQRNHAESSGGGIGVNAGVLQLAGGSIRHNTSLSYGGGVMGSPNANILVGMGAIVSDNISEKNYFHNLYLDGVEDDYPPFSTRPMILGAALSPNANIHVSRWTRPNEEHPYRIIAVPSANYTISEADLAKFHSDDPAYVVRMIDGNIVLTMAPPHVHEWAEEWSYDETAHWHDCIVSDCPLDDLTLKDGYALHQEDAGTIIVPATMEAPGWIEYRCEGCHKIIRTEEIPQLERPHQPDETDPPTTPDSTPDSLKPNTDPKVPVNTNQESSQMESTPNTGDHNTHFNHTLCMLSLMLIAFLLYHIKQDKGETKL